MSLEPEHLQYPWRRPGMDHERYEWSMLSERAHVQWPQGAKLALWVNVGLQFYPLNQQGKPFKVPGGMTMPYPDLRHYSLRDYGNRVGIYRFFQAFDRYGVTPSFAVSARLAERTPYLMAQLRERGNEILCHGWHQDALHFGGQDRDEEAALVAHALDSLRATSGQPVRGWLSPARNESHNTPDLLKAAGIDYFCDWVNDDLPYEFRTAGGPLIAMPLSAELEDYFVIGQNLHAESSWVEQVCDAADLLLAEAAEQGGRILALNIHPWLLGQPHRIAHLERALDYLVSLPGVWPAAPGEILDTWRAQQPGAPQVG